MGTHFFGQNVTPGAHWRRHGTMSEPVVAVVAESVESVDPVTPPASVDVLSSRERCSGAPRRVAKGILASDFIKPDPELTLAERRAYLLEELDHWLTGDICQDADEISMAKKQDELAPYLVEGTWPAARMAVLVQLLADSTKVETAPSFAVRLCKDFLEGRGIDWTDTASLLAVGFVTVDKLPSGKTIRDLWNQSPFEPLRTALPLSTEDDDVIVETDSDSDYDYETDSDSDSEEEDEEEEEEEEEVDIIHRVGPSIDDKINAFLTTDITLSIPGWVVAAGMGATTMYLWMVVASCYSST